MIVYDSSSFGFRNLLRVHGSPVYKAVFPTLFSTSFVLLYDYITDDDGEKVLQHPFAIGAFVGFFSFLLTFRLNFAYSRYWEGATAVHQMISKWTDFAMLLAAFHYQADSYDHVRPPAFGNHPTAISVDVQRQRQQTNALSMEQTLDHVQHLQQQQQQQKQQQRQQQSRGLFGSRRRTGRSETRTNRRSNARPDHSSSHDSENDDSRRIPLPLRFQKRFQPASDVFVSATPTASTTAQNDEVLATSPLSNDATATELQQQQQQQEQQEKSKVGRILQSRRVQMPVPSLFLQESAHLVSLLFGVAMSTLRNCTEGCEVPIVEYIPGKPWPHVNPNELPPELQHKFGGDTSFRHALHFMFGLTRSERHRALYNAARPFTVLGGISDDEVEKLDRARGPYAKVALCTFWLQEFITREILHGSVGTVHHALLSRLHQYVSDGSIGYNQARKIAYVPFPFPHGQMTSLFSFAIMFIFPIFFQSYVNELWFACFLNTLTALCFLGLHEVARELENPFQNIPNDLPLTTFQAQINEALVAMYAGYHPEAHWSIVAGTTPVMTKKVSK